MSTSKALDHARKNAFVLPFDDSSKLIMMSDCHRGDGGWNDNFSNNQNSFYAALNHYYKYNFTYIELGDGDELWENRNISNIISAHSDVFSLMSQFYKNDRLHMLYGNHDIVKKSCAYCANKYSSFYDEDEQKKVPLFPDIDIHESIILKYTPSNHEIFLTHGHQGDLLNDTFWQLARFLVRHVWRPLELIGFQNPIHPARGYDEENKVEKKLIQWCQNEKSMLIAGHTHRPRFPIPGDPMYFNDGSCVHPRWITAIEIEQGAISLVKWSVQTKKDRSLYIERTVLSGPIRLMDYWEK